MATAKKTPAKKTAVAPSDAEAVQAAAPETPAVPAKKAAAAAKKTRKAAPKAATTDAAAVEPVAVPVKKKAAAVKKAPAQKSAVPDEAPAAKTRITPNAAWPFPLSNKP